jgi:hypothetical protein
MALLGAKEFFAIGNFNNETCVVANEKPCLQHIQ